MPSRRNPFLPIIVSVTVAVPVIFKPDVVADALAAPLVSTNVVWSMPLKFEPSPYRVSKYPLANLTVLVPISLALSVFGTIFPETVGIPVILTWPVAVN